MARNPATGRRRYGAGRDPLATPERGVARDGVSLRVRGRSAAGTGPAAPPAAESRFDLDRNRDVVTRTLELLPGGDGRSVDLDVFEDNGRDMLAHEQAGLRRFVEDAIVEDEIGQGILAAVDVDMAAVILEGAADKLEIVQQIG